MKLPEAQFRLIEDLLTSSGWMRVQDGKYYITTIASLAAKKVIDISLAPGQNGRILTNQHTKSIYDLNVKMRAEPLDYWEALIGTRRIKRRS